MPVDISAIGNLSPSKLENLILCPARLLSKMNLLGEEEVEEEKGDEAKIGVLAHAAAKWWYRPCEEWKKRIARGDDPDAMQRQAQAMRDRVLAQITSPTPSEEEKESLQQQINDVDEQINQEGLLKHPWSSPEYCLHKAMMECRKARFGSELISDPANIEEAKRLFGLIRNHYDRNVLNIVFAERKYKGDLGNGVPVSLIIDLALDRGSGRLEIVDYKTGMIACTTEEMYSKHQVLMNLMALHKHDASLAMYPEKSFTYFWVQMGTETGPVSQTWEQLTDYEYFLAEKYQELVDHVVAAQKPETKAQVPEHVNRFCRSCPRRFRCTKYQEMVTEAMCFQDVLGEEQLKALGDDQIMARFEEIGQKIKLLENAKGKLSEILLAELEKRKVKCIEGEKHKCSLRQNRADSIDGPTVVSLCQINGVDLASVASFSKKKVEAAFANNAEAMKRLGLTMRRGMASAYPDVRAKKADAPESGKKSKKKAAPESSS